MLEKCISCGCRKIGPDGLITYAKGSRKDHQHEEPLRVYHPRPSHCAEDPAESAYQGADHFVESD